MTDENLKLLPINHMSYEDIKYIMPKGLRQLSSIDKGDIPNGGSDWLRHMWSVFDSRKITYYRNKKEEFKLYLVAATLCFIFNDFYKVSFDDTGYGDDIYEWFDYKLSDNNEIFYYAGCLTPEKEYYGELPANHCGYDFETILDELITKMKSTVMSVLLEEFSYEEIAAELYFSMVNNIPLNFDIENDDFFVYLKTHTNELMNQATIDSCYSTFTEAYNDVCRY